MATRTDAEVDFARRDLRVTPDYGPIRRKELATVIQKVFYKMPLTDEDETLPVELRTAMIGSDHDWNAGHRELPDICRSLGKY